MQIKKYRAPTIREATSMVKDILGPEAMIISTKKINEKNGDRLFEVSAVTADEDMMDNRLTPLSELKSELMSIKEMINLLNHSGSVMEKLMTKPAIINLYAKLIRNGVQDQYARTLFEKVGAFEATPHEQINGLKTKIIQQIMQVIEVNDPFDQRHGKQILSAFIGTTGVGKTTTIAKLAAHLMLKARKKVGLISVDSYRIGAIEQLKTYANILGIPCLPAFNKKDLVFALKKMEMRDVILIDTAGQSQYDRARIEELKRMIADDLEINSQLLLSVSTKESEMERASLNFSSLKCQSYIFTKVDESQKCGSLINQIMKRRLPVSYITTGQNVPEDIEKAEKEKIFNLIMNKS
jgi:flagellar biosynthesis protein FlhF